jgi:cytochrome oxidase Cu insertion factor (SCO1/SenC/PrrC family)
MKQAFLILLAATAIAHADVKVGQSAPDFTLTDCSGKSVSLSDFKGKTVVLEWVNHGCPFVVKHYGSGNMQKLQANATAKGAVWLSICSSAPGKQGHMPPADAAKKYEEVKSAATAYLLDESGEVGKKYGAKRTPEMYVVNAEGILVYHGAIDDRPSTDPGDIAGSKNFVAAALEETLAGKPVSTPQTEAYGCSVKYGN